MTSHPAASKLGLSRRSTLAAVLCLALAPVAVRADAVLKWNEIAVNAAIAAGQSPFAQGRVGAIVQVAVFTAVNAITQEYEPYVDSVTAPQGASVDAAAITAAYTVVNAYFGLIPAVHDMIEPAHADSLAAIPDGPAKDAGIQVGEAAAAAIMALRVGDGSTPAQTYTAPLPTPGGWQPTANCPTVGGVKVGSFLHWGSVTPFAVEDVSAFLPPPPPSVTSNEYAKAFNEVKRVGSAASTDRPDDRAAVVRFYAVSSPTYIFDMVARQLAEAAGRSPSDNARSLALINMAINDALVASFHAKYTYTFWRPETAIAGAASDGNEKTDADATFAPFIATPCFPSYPSNHGTGSGAAAEMLRRLYGAAGFSVEVANPAAAGISLHYSKLADMVNDVSDARVYGGIHFRFDQDAGERLGREVATAVYKSKLRPLHGE